MRKRGCHLIDQPRQIFGYVIDYGWGELKQEVLSQEVDSYGKYVIRFTSGVPYRIESS